MVFAVFWLAVLMELVDSSLGMMYGTLLSPLLILMGYDAKIVVPSLVLSQALGGLVGSVRHNGYGNARLFGWTADSKSVLAIVVPGLAAVVLGVFTALHIPQAVLTIYIGGLVIAMGVLCMRPVYYTFSWWKMWLIGLISGFNKAASGGGFGPITSTGKILAGQEAKASVATTTLSEVPICLASFATWVLMGQKVDWPFTLTLCVGAAIGGFLGPYVTLQFPQKWLRFAVGALAVAAGVMLLAFRMKI